MQKKKKIGEWPGLGEGRRIQDEVAYYIRSMGYGVASFVIRLGVAGHSCFLSARKREEKERTPSRIVVAHKAHKGGRVNQQ